MKRFRLFNHRSPRHTKRGGKSTSGITPPKKWWRRWLWYLNPTRFRDFWFTRAGGITALKLFGIWAAIGFGLIVVLFLWFAKDLPTPGQINSKILAQTTRFYDRTGQTVLYEVHGDQNRTVVKLDQMSPWIKDATIAIEDRNFYHHGAFSVFSILRAAINDVLHRTNGLQGGSTITEQYVKNALLTNQQSLTRKIKELILSIEVEQLYSKDDILQLYLNEIPYGSEAYGVQAAAKTYFNKDAKDLTIDESALLAALPQAPSYYSPYGQNVDALLARRDVILDQMHFQGYINNQQYATAKSTDTYAKVNDVPNLFANVIAPHFVLYAQQYLSEKYGETTVDQGGLNVITTLDVGLQKKAEAAVKGGMSQIDAVGGNNAALVAADPNTGQIEAMVGSRDFNYPKFGAFNAATSYRQPGSSFKPYVYAAGFETNAWGPGSTLYDVRTDFGGGYTPVNYDNRYHGVNSARWFLANSINIPAVKMLYIVGLTKALDTAHQLGITTLQNASDYGLSLVLGSGGVKLTDHVNGYESFANGGLHYAQTPILKVTDSKGNVLEDNSKPVGTRVLDPQVAYLIDNILSDVPVRSYTFGFNPYMTVPGHTVFVKTGSTDNDIDGWMMGGSRDLIAGVWVGNNANTPMRTTITSLLTGKIWGPFMTGALKGHPNLPFVKPAGIKTVTLDAYTGTLSGPGTKSTRTDIFPSWYVPKPYPTAQTAVIDKKTGKLATDCTATKDKETISAVTLHAELPSSDPEYALWNPPVVALGNALGFSGKGIPTTSDPQPPCPVTAPSITDFTANKSPGPGHNIDVS